MHDGVAQLRERQEVAAVQRELHDLAVLDDVADLGVRQLQKRRFRGHSDFFHRPADVEREIEIQRLPELNETPERRMRRNPSRSAEIRWVPTRRAGRK